MKKIKIKDMLMSIPIIQGGMGIGISRSRLAGAVASEGGMGVISTAQIGYDHPDFKKDPEKYNLEFLTKHIKKAKELAKGNGMIAVNLMAVTRLYSDYIKAACAAGVDAIISGAGLPMSLARDTKGTDTAIAPIVSSAKSAQVILKYWDRKDQRTADFLVIESALAGGHLGFSKEEIDSFDMNLFGEEIKKIIEVKRIYEEKYACQIPVFVGGGIFDKSDVEWALSLGADGVQVGSRFVTTKECDASEAFKQAYVDAKKEDIVIIQSPVGLPGRAINNKFVQEMMNNGQVPITWCYSCMKACNPKVAKYCISSKLIDAVKGDVENGLVFCGKRTDEIKEITSVPSVIADLLGTIG